MSARRYSQFSQNRPGKDDGTPPSPGHKGAGKKMYESETPSPYKADIGPGGPDLNKGAKFAKVKAYAKKHGFC